MDLLDPVSGFADAAAAPVEGRDARVPRLRLPLAICTQSLPKHSTQSAQLSSAQTHAHHRVWLELLCTSDPFHIKLERVQVWCASLPPRFLR